MIRHFSRWSIATLPLIAVLTGCGSDSAKPLTPPAKAEAVAHESDLLKLTLTAQAQQRLGIRTVRIGEGSAMQTRETSGEVVVPSTDAAGVPTGSTSNLAQIGVSQVAVEGEIARSQALVRLAAIASNRADALVREEAGSVRARDEAAAGLATARAALDAARAQRRLLGPSIASIANLSTLWVRVPVFGTDLSAIERGSAATLRPLGGDAQQMAGPAETYHSWPNQIWWLSPKLRCSVTAAVDQSTTCAHAARTQGANKSICPRVIKLPTGERPTICATG